MEILVRFDIIYRGLACVVALQGSFRGGTRGNAVPIVEKLPERMGTAFPLLKCLTTHKTDLKLRKK